MKTSLLFFLLCSLNCLEIPTLAADTYRFEEAKVQKLNDFTKTLIKSAQFRTYKQKFESQKKEFQNIDGLVTSAKIEENKIKQEALSDLDIALTFSNQTLENKYKIEENISHLSMFRRAAKYLNEIAVKQDKEFKFDVDAKITEIKAHSIDFLLSFKKFEDFIPKFREESLVFSELNAKEKSLSAKKGYLSAISSYLKEIDSEELAQIQTVQEEAKRESWSTKQKLSKSSNKVKALKKEIDYLCFKIAVSNQSYLVSILESLDKLFVFFLQEEYSSHSKVYKEDKESQEEESKSLMRKNTSISNAVRRIQMITKINSETDGKKLLKLQNSAQEILDKITISTHSEYNTRKFGFDTVKQPLERKILALTENRELTLIILKQLFRVYSEAIRNFHLVWNFAVNIITKSVRSNLNYTLSSKFRELRKFRNAIKMKLWEDLTEKEEEQVLREYWKAKKEIEQSGNRMMQVIPIMVDRVNWWPLAAALIFVFNCLILFVLVRKRNQEEEEEIKRKLSDSEYSI